MSSTIFLCFLGKQAFVAQCIAARLSIPGERNKNKTHKACYLVTNFSRFTETGTSGDLQRTAPRAHQPSGPQQIGNYLGARLSAIPAQHPSASLVPENPKQGGISVSFCVLLLGLKFHLPTCQLLQGRSFLARDCVSQEPGFTGWQQRRTFLGHTLRREAEPKVKALNSQP